MILALVTSMGMAGIPAASLVGIAVILAAVGLPAEAIGVLLVFDRILDMCRTSINVLADAACTVIVARLEGETGILDCGESGRLIEGVRAPASARPGNGKRVEGVRAPAIAHAQG